MPDDSSGPTTQLYSPLTDGDSWRVDTNCAHSVEMAAAAGGWGGVGGPQGRQDRQRSGTARAT